MKIKMEYQITKEDLKVLVNAAELQSLVSYVENTVYFMKGVSPSTWEETEGYLDQILTVIEHNVK